MKTIRAHIRNGQIIPDEPVDLPEGAAVEVRLPNTAETQADTQGGSILDGLEAFVGKFDGLPADASTSYEAELRRLARGRE